MIHVNLLNLFNDGKIDGVGQYTLNLFRGLSEIEDLKRFNFLVTEDNRSFVAEKFPGVSMTVMPRCRWERFFIYKKTFIKFLYWDSISVPKFMKKHSKDVLFHPYHALSIYTSLKYCTVVTLHDLLAWNHSEDLSVLKRIWSRVKYKQIINNARYLITPSNFVKHDILSKFSSVYGEKIRVLPNPVYIDTTDVVPISVRKPYILSVNTNYPHKNLITLLKAYTRIMDQVEHGLILVGMRDKKTDKQLSEYMEMIGSEKLLITEYLNDSKRNYIYRNASLFVSPSLHEGFGMTPIEATFFDVPVLTTKMTSLPETTLGLLDYYDPPHDDVILSEKLLEMLSRESSYVDLQSIRTTFEELYNCRSVAKHYSIFFDEVERNRGRTGNEDNIP
ncbi:MAG TPA: hypothetical protein DCG34_08270 [Clostridiales bacterium]|nr:hypothetical protein [Clostridiales bacterium]